MPVDRRQVSDFIKEVLKHGTPDWIRWPEDYRHLADEWHQQARENLLEECERYQTQDQQFLSDEKMSRVNMMQAATFMKKLRDNGVKCFSHDSQLRDGSASLSAVTPDGVEAKSIVSIQVPWMWEWSLLRIDPTTNLPNGFRDIGWRSAVLALIKNGVLSERKAYDIFGRPIGPRGRIFRRMVHEYRNGKDRPNATKAA